MNVHPLSEDEDVLSQLGAPGTSSPGTELQQLHTLAQQRSWRALAERTSAAATVAGTAHSVEGTDTVVAALTAASYHGLALARLRSWPALAHLLRAVEAERHTWPFLLRWLGAETLAHTVKRQAGAVAALVQLHSSCAKLIPEVSQDDIDFSALSEEPENAGYAVSDFQPSPPEEDGAAWARRAIIVALSLASHHARLGDSLTALKWLQWALQRRPHDLTLISQGGLLLLSLGDLEGATAMFAKVEASPQARGTMIRHNAGLLLFAQRDWKGALKQFQAASNADPTDPAAANNAAVARIYDGQGARAAVEQLEGAMKASSSVLTEATARTLVSLYGLAAPGRAASHKQSLAAWAVTAAPEDFDPACFK